MRRDRRDSQWFDVLNAEDRTAYKKLIIIKNWTDFFLFTITPNQFLRYSYKTRYASTKIEAS